MQIDILQGAFFLAAFIASLYGWQKYKNVGYLWLGSLAAIGVLINIWDYLATNVLQLSLQVRLINSRILLALWIVFVLLVPIVAFKKSRPTNR